MGNQTLLEKQKTRVLKELQELIDEKIPVGFTSSVLTEMYVAEYMSIHKDVVPVLDRMFNGDLTVQEIAVERNITSASVHRIRHKEEKRLSWMIFKSTKKVDLKKWKGYVFPSPKDFCLYGGNIMDKYNISEENAKKIFPLPESWAMDDLKFEMNNYFSESLRKTLREVNNNLGQFISVIHPICEFPFALFDAFDEFESNGYVTGLSGHPNIFKAPINKVLSALNYIKMAKIDFGISDEQISEFEESVQVIQEDIKRFDHIDWKNLKDIVETDNWRLSDIPRGLVCRYLKSVGLTINACLYWPIKYNNTLEVLSLEELENKWAFTYPYIDTDKASFVEVTPMDILIPELTRLKEKFAPIMPALPRPSGFNPDRYNMHACMLNAISTLKKNIINSTDFHNA